MEIRFENVEFAYDKEHDPIIQDFSLEAKEGDRIALKGASGSGKTTLLLLGFETPDNGTILFNGKPLNPKQLKELRKNTSWLPQDLDLGADKLKEVFYYPFSFKINTSKRPKEEAILSTFDALGLNKNVWEGNFKDLSTGQRQRVGVALCHLLGKAVLLLDEPTSALDETSKEKVGKLLFDDKRIIISTSHDPWWLERCSQIIELN
jgi:ABC-type bacteriocin/lantibiotic exporter with double-glycine peptidase domain